MLQMLRTLRRIKINPRLRLGLFQPAAAVLLMGFILNESLAQTQRGANTKSFRTFVYQGRILGPGGKPVNGEYVLNAKITSAEPSSCILWSEKQTVTVKGGTFSAEIGHDGNRVQGFDGGVSQSFSQVFVNNPNLVLVNASCANGSVYTSNPNEDRILHAVFESGPTKIEIAPLPIKSVPYALQAEAIGGYGLPNLMKISGPGSSVVFTPEETDTLKTALGDNLLWNFAAKRLTNLANPAAPQDAATMSWVQSQISSVSITDGRSPPQKLQMVP